VARLAAAILLVAPAAALAQALPPENAIVALVNAARAQAGLNPLVSEAKLGRVAIAHATDMARRSFVGHVGSDGAGMIERVVRAGYGYSFVAENVAGGQPTAAAAVATWMASGGHRRNLLAPEATQVGVGHAVENGRTPKYGDYWVIVLGAPAPR